MHFRKSLVSVKRKRCREKSKNGSKTQFWRRVFQEWQLWSFDGLGPKNSAVA
jgi:hypothetical protein